MAETSGFDELELWRGFTQTFRAIRRFLDARLKPLGIDYNEFKVLGELVAGGRTSMAKLAEKIMFTQAGVTYLVDRLEEQGYVVRVRSSEDRRVIFVEITDRGRRVFEEGVSIVREATRRVFEGLSAEELEALHKAFSKIQERAELSPTPKGG